MAGSGRRLAASSIYIRLTHWQIFRHIDDTSRPLALLLALAFGVLYAHLATRLGAGLSAFATAMGLREQRGVSV